MPTTPVSAEHDITSGQGSHILLLTFQPDLWECGAPMNWGPGSWASRHSLTSNVLFNKQRIVLDGHDLGPMLSHLPVFFDFWRSLKSNRKTSYCASQVRANGKPVACIDNAHPMMTCGDPVSLPSGLNRTNAAHNLKIGMSELDEFKGQVGIACSIVTDLFTWLTDPVGFTEIKPDNLARDLMGVDHKKAVIGGIVNMIGSVAVNSASGGSEPITFKTEQGNGFVSMQYEATYNESTGEWDQKTTSNAVGVAKKEAKLFEPDPPVSKEADKDAKRGEQQ